MGLLARNDDVNKITAPQTTISDGKQGVGVRREVDTHNIGFLVDHVVNKTGILMGKTVVILSPDMGCKQVVEGCDGSSPRNLVPGDLQPFRVLIEHRIHDVDKSLITGEKTVTSG
jgi:hypothetical protein